MSEETKALETITFNQFDWMSAKTGAIQLSIFDDEVYNATLIIWVNKEEFPLFLETSICCLDVECVISQAYNILTNLADDIFTCITVYDENGDELEELDLNDYLESEGDSDEE